MEDNRFALESLIDAFWHSLGGCGGAPVDVDPSSDCGLPSVFRVADFAAATVAAAAAAAAEYGLVSGGPALRGRVSATHAAAAFRPFRHLQRLDGTRELPSVWDPIAGNYRTRDGHIRLHTNYAHHRRAALSVLRVAEEREEVSRAVATWEGEALEEAIVRAGGCAAVMRSREAWLSHPQGEAVRAQPLMSWQAVHIGSAHDLWAPSAAEPGLLAGLRVLDLTRVIAGPVCTGTLAAHGASVVRLDCPDFEEGLPLIAETTRGKRCARLDLRSTAGRDRFEALLRQAHVLVCGLRPGALAALGYDDAALRTDRPDLVIAHLSAYGDDGPWGQRRGFDSLVQMSTGIAETGMRRGGGDAPCPLPAQALDHGAGYLLAAAVLRALTRLRAERVVSTVSTSLARVAEALFDAGDDGNLRAPDASPDLATPFLEESIGPLGHFRQLTCPVVVPTVPQVTMTPARALGADGASFA